METFSGSSKVTVKIWSTNTKTVISSTMGDAESEILTVSTSKDLVQPAGSFQITLVPRTDPQGRTWFDKIHPFDFVEISFKGIKDEKEFVVMRGLIDFVSKSEGYEGGTPNRQISVNGRDLGCLLTDFQIYYMPELGRQEAVRAQMKVLAWEVDPKLIVNAKEAFEFLWRYWFQHIDLTVQAKPAPLRISQYLMQSAESFIPGNYTSLFFLMQYQGSWLGAFQQFQDKPFHEFFLYDDEKTSWLIFRPARLKDARGNYAPVVEEIRQKGYSWMYPADISIEKEEKISMAVQKGGTEIYTYYFTVPTQELISKEKYRMALMNINNPRASINPYIASNPNFPSHVKRYGFRPLEATTTFAFQDVGQISGQGRSTEDIPALNAVARYQQGNSQGKPYLDGVIKPTFYETGIDLNKTLVTWFLHNPLLYHGSVDITGTNRATIGTYLWDKDDNEGRGRMEYYIEGVSHSFVQLQSFRTSLRITRGMPWEGLAQKEGDVNVFYFDGDLPEEVRAPAIMEPDEMVEEQEWPSESRYLQRWKQQKTKEVKPKYKSYYDPKSKGRGATGSY